MRIMFIPLILVSLFATSCADGGGPSIPILGSDSAEAKKERRTKLKDPVIEFDTEDVPPSNKESPKRVEGQVDFSGIATNGWHAALAARISNGAPYGYLLCGKGQEVIKFTDYDDFSDVFNVVCDKGVPNSKFAQILNDAYTGTGEPKISQMPLKTNDLFVTDFIYAFAIKIPVASPAALTGFPIYEEVGKGMKTPESEIKVTKGKETSFPGLGVVRSIEQEYSMPFAKGAALFDKRKTLTNTYLVVESSNDINLSTEHLLNPDQTEFYHATRQIVFGIKGETPGTTYLVYIAQMVVINRFDPQRLTSAATELAAQIPKIVLNTVKKGK